MLAALRYIASAPGCTNYEAATAIGPHGSHGYGDRIVKRCLGRGLITNRAPQGARAYAWHVTPAGRLELKADMVRRRDIVALSQAAAEAGDMDQVILCSRALRGAVDGPNWQACARVVAGCACADCCAPYESTCIVCDAQLCEEHGRSTSQPGDTFCADVLRCTDRLHERKHLT
jgi:hypothetical protein